MASSPTEIQRHFRRSFPPDVLHGFARCVWAAYADAHKICSDHLLRDQAHDVRGHLRRAVIERNWKNYARRIPDARVHQESNAIGSSRHVVVELGGVALTQSLAEGPNDIIQKARFRDTYAEASQIDLFAVPGHSKRRPDAKLYAMFLHGASDNPAQPRFMSVVFPTRDCDAYVYEATINVLGEFSDLAQSIRADRIEDIGDELMLELRRIDDDEEEAAS